MKIIHEMTSSIEKRFHENPLFFRMYSLPYRGVIKREIELADLSGKETVLNVGCGALPFTAVQIAERTNKKVYALDKEKKSFEAARELIKTLGLEESIKVLKRDGTDPIEIDFDAAFVSLQVHPKRKVIDNLSGLKSSTKLIVREPRDGLKSMYGSLPDRMDPDDHVRHCMPTFDRSVLYDFSN